MSVRDRERELVRARIVEMYLAGHPVQQIKAVTGTSVIYPALRHAGIEPARSKRYRGDQLELSKEEIRTALRAAADDLGATILAQRQYIEWRRSHPEAPTLQTISRVFQQPWATVLAEVGLSSANTTRVTNNDIIGWLQAALAQAGTATLTTSEYDHWRQQHQPDAVCAATITTHLGWSNACRQAGFKPATSPDRTTPRFTDADLVKALTQAAATNPVLTTLAYDQWRLTHQNAPSSHTIIRRLGWTKAKQLAGLKPAATKKRPTPWAKRRHS